MATEPAEPVSVPIHPSPAGRPSFQGGLGVLQMQVLKRNYYNSAFVHNFCLVLHRLYSGGYYGVTTHTVFSHLIAKAYF